MKIIKIEIANIFSFGPKQEIDHINQFNLFIGKNGSGKTNTLRVLGDISLDYDSVEGNIEVTTGQSRRTTPVWIAKIPRKNLNENVIQHEYDSIGDLTIEFENEWMLHGKTVDKEIIFKNSNHFQGNYALLKHHVTYLDKPISDSKYYEIFLESFNNDDITNLALLNFGIKYIFDDRLLIGGNSHLTAFYTDDGIGKSASGGVVSFEPIKWSSGTLHIAKVIQQVILSKKVLLIDEIEQHLEPRICRKLIQYIFWLCSYGKKKPSVENETLNNITDKWNNWNPNNIGFKKFDRGSDCASFEEHGIATSQVFISTHSSVLIQEFLAIESSASIYEFDLKWMDNSFDPNLPIRGGNWTDEEKREGKAVRKTLFTNVRRIDYNVNNILNNLGTKGSDLLQVNGIIWVEGPSDVIYIKKWLEMYACENDKPSFKQGRDYEFQMFGGTLLDSLCLIKEGEDEEELYKKLVSMFSFSRNTFVVIDSDAVQNSDGNVIDKSKFYNAKTYIKEEFEVLKKAREGLGLWYEEGNTDIRTMESYLDLDSTNFIKKGWTKKIAAQKVTKNWSVNKKLSDFRGGLGCEIRKLYNSISYWNN